jgi:hypothetical protein
MTDTAGTQDQSHRLVVAMGFVALVIAGALSVFNGEAPDYGAAVTGAMIMASATFGYRPNLAALRSR